MSHLGVTLIDTLIDTLIIIIGDYIRNKLYSFPLLIVKDIYQNNITVVIIIVKTATNNWRLFDFCVICFVELEVTLVKSVTA